MNGIALTVLLSQIPKLFGFSVDTKGPVRQAAAIVHEVLLGRTNVIALAVGAGTLVLILVLKRRPRVPGTLIAVVAATVLVDVLNLATRAGVKVLGPLPQGLPTPTLPLIHIDDLLPVLTGGLAAALVSFADTSVLSRTYAARMGTRAEPNQEMIGLGLANLAAGFFQGFPVSSSSSRTPVAEAAGARTQLTGVVGAIAITLLLVLAPGRRCHRRSHRIDRGLRPAPYLPHPAVGILVVNGVLRRCRRVRHNSRYCNRDRHRGDRIPLGWLAPTLRHTRTSR
jgi:MFS superfamily sulfate permease-like transporter